MEEMILIAGISFIANIIGTVSGFGVGTIMTPLLVLIMPYGQMILFVCIVHWFHDLFKIFFFKSGIDWKLFIYFGIPTIVAASIGALFVSETQSSVLTSLLGLFLIGSVGMMYIVDQFSIPNNWITGFIGGAISGFFAGMFGIRGAVRSVFMAAFDLKKATFLGTTGVISLLLDTTRFITYYFHGITMKSSLWLALIICVPISFIGSMIGVWIVNRIPEERFRGVVAFFLLVVGIKLLLTPWIGW